MKKSKKLKIITSSSVIATAATITPLVATSCTASNVNNANNPNWEANADINIASLSWGKATVYDTKDIAELRARVIQDNNTLFSQYQGLYQGVTITPSYDALQSDPIKIVIEAKNGSGYTGSVLWYAQYSATPTPTTDLETLTINTSSIPRTVEPDAPSADYYITAYKANGNPTSGFDVLTATSSDPSIITASGDKTTGKVTIQPVTGKTSGTVNIWINVKDIYGNYGGANVTVSISSSSVVPSIQTLIVDATAIPKFISAPSTNETGNVIAYLPTDPTTKIESFKTMTVKSSDEAIIVATGDKSTGVVTVTPAAGVTSGSVNVWIEVEDENGNIGGASVSVAISEPTSPTIKTLIVDATAIPKTIVPGEAKTATIKAHQPGGGGEVTFTTLDITPSVEGIFKITVTDKAKGEITIEVEDGVTSGSANLWVSVADGSGDTGGASVSVSVQEPAPKQTLTVDATKVPKVIIPGDQETVQISAYLPGNSTAIETFDTLTVVQSVDLFTISTTPSTGQIFIEVKDGVTSGSANLWITVTDENGNTGGASVSISVDTSICKEIEYLDLADLIENNALITGRQYRITDFTTRTNSAQSTKYKSDEYYFDLIVTATSSNTLSENAKATKNANDNHFPETTNFNAWEIKYCFANDNTRFAWANTDTQGGTGNPLGKGVIYYMKDEFGNEAGYDFKNIQYIAGDQTYFTFTVINTIVTPATNEDGSLYGTTKNIHDNKIAPYYDAASSSYALNEIYFIGTNVYNNTFDNGCRNITFDQNSSGIADVYNNTFGNGCRGMTFGANANGNKFDTNCNTNTFGISCVDNTFGSGFVNNTIGNCFNSNTFGQNCINNKFTNTSSNISYHSNNDFSSGTSGLTVSDKVAFDHNTVIATSNVSYTTATSYKLIYAGEFIEK